MKLKFCLLISMFLVVFSSCFVSASNFTNIQSLDLNATHINAIITISDDNGIDKYYTQVWNDTLGDWQNNTAVTGISDYLVLSSQTVNDGSTYLTERADFEWFFVTNLTTSPTEIIIGFETGGLGGENGNCWGEIREFNEITGRPSFNVLYSSNETYSCSAIKNSAINFTFTGSSHTADKKIVFSIQSTTADANGLVLDADFAYAGSEYQTMRWQKPSGPWLTQTNIPVYYLYGLLEFTQDYYDGNSATQINASDLVLKEFDIYRWCAEDDLGFTTCSENQTITPIASDPNILPGSVYYTSSGNQSIGLQTNGTYLTLTAGDSTPTFTAVTNGSATCSLNGTECGTTGGKTQVCTYPSALPEGLNQIDFVCVAGDFSNNGTAANTLNITIAIPPVVTTIYPTDAQKITDTKLINFNCSATDNNKVVNLSLYINGTINVTNITDSASVEEAWYFDWTVYNNGDYEYTCEACDNNSNCAFGDNKTFTFNWTGVALTSELCPNMTKIEFIPNISYYNITTGTLTQYGIEPTNQSICNWSYTMNTTIVGDIQAQLNISLGSTFNVVIESTNITNSWTTIYPSAPTGSYYYNITGDYIGATAESDDFKINYRVV